MIGTLTREIGRDLGIGLLLIERGVHWVISWEENAEKAAAFFGRRKGDFMQLESLLKYESAIPEIKAAALAIVALIEKIEAINAASAATTTGGTK